MVEMKRTARRIGSIVLIEQNAKLVFDVADDIVILNSGGWRSQHRPPS